jgi:AraC-like DNA-binding protein
MKPRLQAEEDYALTLRSGLRSCASGLMSGETRLRLTRAGQEYRKGSEGHFHSSAELFVQLSGYTRFSFPDECLSLLPGEALIVPPRVPHAEKVGSLEGPFRNIVVLAEGDTVLSHIACEREPGQPGIFYTENRKPRIARSLALWLGEAAAWGASSDPSPLAVGLTVAALSGLGEALEEEGSPAEAEPRLIGRARRIIGDRVGDSTLSVASLAKALSCSADYLSHSFRNRTGRRLVDYIHELRMERASDLLLSTELSSKEIAWACGFSNHSYFIRVFRRRYAASPLEFRASRPGGRTWK